MAFWTKLGPPSPWESASRLLASWIWVSRRVRFRSTSSWAAAGISGSWSATPGQTMRCAPPPLSSCAGGGEVALSSGAGLGLGLGGAVAAGLAEPARGEGGQVAGGVRRIGRWLWRCGRGWRRVCRREGGGWRSGRSWGRLLLGNRRVGCWLPGSGYPGRPGPGRLRPGRRPGFPGAGRRRPGRRWSPPPGCWPGRITERRTGPARCCRLSQRRPTMLRALFSPISYACDLSFRSWESPVSEWYGRKIVWVQPPQQEALRERSSRRGGRAVSLRRGPPLPWCGGRPRPRGPEARTPCRGPAG